MNSLMPRTGSGPITYLRQHLDTRRKGHREALKEHEARGAGGKGGGSGGASRRKYAESAIASMDGVKPFIHEQVGSVHHLQL